MGKQAKVISNILIPSEVQIEELTIAVAANTRAVRALTKRLNEQTIDTDAVSVISLVERSEELGDENERLKRDIRRRTR